MLSNAGLLLRVHSLYTLLRGDSDDSNCQNVPSHCSDCAPWAGCYAPPVTPPPPPSPPTSPPSLSPPACLCDDTCTFAGTSGQVRLIASAAMAAPDLNTTFARHGTDCTDCGPRCGPFPPLSPPPSLPPLPSPPPPCPLSRRRRRCCHALKCRLLLLVHSLHTAWKHSDSNCQNVPSHCSGCAAEEPRCLSAS